MILKEIEWAIKKAVSRYEFYDGGKIFLEPYDIKIEDFEDELYYVSARACSRDGCDVGVSLCVCVIDGDVQDIEVVDIWY